jgi:hypothetical protein
MPDEISQAGAPEIQASAAPKDLRAGLAADLRLAFSANLSASGALPKAASEGLVALLDASSPVPADVIAALKLDDPAQPEVPNE